MEKAYWVIFIWLALLAVGALGWVANVVKLAHMCCEPSGWLILRAIGVVLFPLGAVLGVL